jgi:hypothetical protein
MPTVLCHACAKPTSLPDAWAKPSYDCPFCGVVVSVTLSPPRPVPPPAPRHPPAQTAVTHYHTVGGGFKNAFGAYLGRSMGTVVVGLVVLVVGVVILAIAAAVK